ncbi:CAP domain-containing protein [Methanobrevibacter filiformis]|uniref:Cysteine-rich secretory protein family protein n=1 Tax=Methanobrevibacter filiformis TaxID=55758 RepID=A0A166CSL0_9EURY|nr:CAP domain-containing protein [Methanobrevibacter filiformis]KZX14819.1 cysteine-rich secretory protein family protein [Methanobrevibacter filiformis]
MGKIYLKAVFIIAIMLFTIVPAFAATSNVTSSDDFTNQVLKLVNQERAKVGLDPLQVDQRLVDAAKIRAKELLTQVSHTRPNGQIWYTVSDYAYGENLAAGPKTPKEVVTAWINSNYGHKEAILNKTYKTIGIAYIYSGNNKKYGTHYWVQLFGLGDKSSSSAKSNSIISKSSNISNSNKGHNDISNLSTILNSNKDSKDILNLKSDLNSNNIISNLKFSLKSNLLTIKWNKQSSSITTGYQVLKYNSGKYTVLTTLKSNKKNGITIKLQSATKYMYKIRSYKRIAGKNKYGKLSPEVKVITKPLKTSITKLSSKKNKVTITINKVSRASGYEIYRSVNIGCAIINFSVDG